MKLVKFKKKKDKSKDEILAWLTEHIDKIEDLVMIGWWKGTDEFFFLNSPVTLGALNWTLDTAKFKLMTEY